MQPMPAKNRTAVAVGAALLALVVGGVALWSANRTAQPTPHSVEEMPMTGESAHTTPAPTGMDPANAAPSLTGTSSSMGTSAITGTSTGTSGSSGLSATAAAPKASESVPETYVVQPGDTLYSIALKFYSNPNQYGVIESLNGLEDANVLQAGTTLKLPRPETLH